AVTQFVIGASGLVKNHGLVLLGVVVAAVTIYKFLGRTRRGRLVIDSFKLRMPLFGNLNRKTAISRFARTLGTLVTSGVPILQALNITRETAGNAAIARAISRVHDSVKEGESIVQPLEASRVFPPMVVSMVDVGEETGKLPDMLLKIADVYGDEVDNAVAAITSMLEPIRIVFLALIVSTIVLALFTPLISMITGLVLSTAGYARTKGARARAETEIAAMSAACESYKADNAIYPHNSDSDNLDAQMSGDPTTYQAASLYLYNALFGATAGSRTP